MGRFSNKYAWAILTLTLALTGLCIAFISGAFSLSGADDGSAAGGPHESQPAATSEQNASASGPPEGQSEPLSADTSADPSAEPFDPSGMSGPPAASEPNEFSEPAQRNPYIVVFHSNKEPEQKNSQIMMIGETKALLKNKFYQTGYLFQGWAAFAQGEVLYADTAQVKNLTSTPGATVHLYAVWRPITYTVQFNPNGGDGNMDPLLCEYDSIVHFPAATFTKAGYLFIGWAYTDAQVVEFTDKAMVKNLLAVDGTVAVVHAVWKKTNNALALVFDPGDAVGKTHYQLILPGETKKLTANKFSRAGYLFQGWATSAGGPVAYADEAQMENTASTQGETVKLYAVWQPITYTIMFDSGGGTGEMAPVACAYDEDIALPLCRFVFADDPESAFLTWRFAGWATSITGAAEYGDAAVVQNLTAENQAVVTLYATWETKEAITGH